MLSARTIVARDGVTLADVDCRHGAGRGAAGEHSGGRAVVLVRRGCFVRSADGVDTLLDPTTGYCTNPGQEERYDHPHGDGDACTSIGLSATMTASLWGGGVDLPAGPVRVTPGVDLEHRLLLAAGRRDADPHELAERAVGVAAAALEHADARRVAAGRPSTARAHRTLVDGVREALVERPDRSLPELAAALASSPHHLSRVFRATTGDTIARHRRRLRVRAALDRLAGGESDLARLAADLGFADHGHLTRVVRAETGTTPSLLRRALR